MGAPPRQQDLNDLKDPSKPILITTTYPYNNMIYPATFSEVLNQNRSDSSHPAGLVISSHRLSSFVPEVSPAVWTQRRRYYTKAFISSLVFRAGSSWLHCVETSSPVISHIYFKMLQRSRVSLSVHVHNRPWNTPGTAESYGFTSKITMLGTEETSLEHICHSGWLGRLERPAKMAAQIYICR